MAKRTEGYDEAILQCARKEFLEKGYEDASLRTIAKNAEVSTSMIYTRYGDKEGLFKALVSPAAEKVVSYMEKYMDEFTCLEPGVQEEGMSMWAERGYDGFLDILYDHFDEFRLMITSSTNGLYRHYLERIVELDMACTVKFLEATGNPAWKEGRITEGFIHILSSGFYSGLFEIAVHNIERSEAEKYLGELRLFYQSGWQRYL